MVADREHTAQSAEIIIARYVKTPRDERLMRESAQYMPFFAPGDPAYAAQITQPFSPPSAYSTWTSAPPEFTLRSYKAVFDALYERSAEKTCVFPLTVHDFITGRPSRAKVLDSFIAYAKQFKGVVFTTHDELAGWWRANYTGIGTQDP